MMKCDNCIRNGVCRLKAHFLEMHPLGKIGWCYKFSEKDSEPKPMTNGDRIRAMTDEELAMQFIYFRDDWDDYETPAGFFEDDEEAYIKTVEWLKQPAESEG